MSSSASNHQVRPVVDHWFDFICPFCYVGQTRSALLRGAGSEVRELPYRIHPEIGPGGVPAPDRVGPTYEALADAAREAGLPLRWSPRIAYSRPALSLSEVVRLQSPEAHGSFVARVFESYFGEGLDIERPDVLRDCLEASVLRPPDPLLAAAATEGEAALAESEQLARGVGVTGTPAWLIEGWLVVGLQPESVFDRLAHEAVRPTSQG